MDCENRGRAGRHVEQGATFASSSFRENTFSHSQGHLQRIHGAGVVSGPPPIATDWQTYRQPTRPTYSKCSHIAVPALDGLADHRCRDIIGDLDVPHFAFALGGEVGEQLRDYRHIAYLVAAQAEAASD